MKKFIITFRVDGRDYVLTYNKSDVAKILDQKQIEIGGYKQFSTIALGADPWLFADPEIQTFNTFAKAEQRLDDLFTIGDEYNDQSSVSSDYCVLQNFDFAVHRKIYKQNVCIKELSYGLIEITTYQHK